MNRVFINSQGLVEIIVDGDQTVESVKKMADKTEKLCAKLSKSGQPSLVLDNLLFIGYVPPEARKLVVEEVKRIDYDKLAMVGKGTAFKLAANLLLRATGRGAKVRYFDDYHKATEWLQDALPY